MVQAQHILKAETSKICGFRHQPECRHGRRLSAFWVLNEPGSDVTPDDRLWHFSEVTLALGDVGSWGQNGHREQLRPSPSVTPDRKSDQICILR